MIPYGEPEGRVSRAGKQVLLDGRHFADGTDEAAAEAIALAIHYSGLEGSRIPREHQAKIEAVLA